MTDDSLAYKIRVSIGKAFHHKHHDPEGKVDLEGIASEHGVSEDQVREQLGYLRQQNLIGGPLEFEGEQIRRVPSAVFDDHHLTPDGVAWAASSFPLI